MRVSKSIKFSIWAGFCSILFFYHAGISQDQPISAIGELEKSFADLPIIGFNFVQPSAADSLSQLRIVHDSYIVGPGDQIIIDAWGDL